MSGSAGVNRISDLRQRQDHGKELSRFALPWRRKKPALETAGVASAHGERRPNYLTSDLHLSLYHAH